MDKVFSFNLNDILSIFISAVIVYFILIFYIRVLGKRSTSEFNSFDWIVTVSIGSIFAKTVIVQDISVFDGSIGILILLILQYVTTKIMKKSKQFRNVVKASPQLLLFKGEFLEENLEKERILKAEIYAEVRQKGLKSIKNIYAVVLETNSKLSVIPNEDSDEIGFSLRYVLGLPDCLKDDLKNYDDKII